MTTTAKLFRNGRTQAIRLPREFRFEGDRVRVRRSGRGVVIEPMFANVTDWFAQPDLTNTALCSATARRSSGLSSARVPCSESAIIARS